MLKFIVGDKLIIVDGEEDMLASHLSSLRYIEADCETLETSFQALEVAAMSKKCDTQETKTPPLPWGQL